MKKIEPMYCKECGHLGMPVTETPGSFVVELFLWVCLILPGMFYTAWRIAGRGPVCPKCHIKNAMVPADSPRARKLMTDDQKRELDEGENFLARHKT